MSKEAAIVVVGGGYVLVEYGEARVIAALEGILSVDYESDVQKLEIEYDHSIKKYYGEIAAALYPAVMLHVMGVGFDNWTSYRELNVKTNFASLALEKTPAFVPDIHEAVRHSVLLVNVDFDPPALFGCTCETFSLDVQQHHETCTLRGLYWGKSRIMIPEGCTCGTASRTRNHHQANCPYYCECSADGPLPSDHTRGCDKYIQPCTCASIRPMGPEHDPDCLRYLVLCTCGAGDNVEISKHDMSCRFGDIPF